MSAQTRIYHLIRTAPRAELKRKVNGNQRIPYEVIPNFKLPGVYTFRDKEGKNRTFRYIAETDQLDQTQQIKDGFLANRKRRQADAEDLVMKMGVIETNKPNLIEFLDNAPFNEKFEGDRGSYQVLFKEFVPSIATKLNNNLAISQAKAMLAVSEMSDDMLTTKLLKIHGGVFDVPAEKEEKIEALMYAINSATEENKTLSIILEDKTGDTVETIIGRAVNADVLSFLQNPTQIMLKRNGKWENFMAISESHTEDQKLALFIDRVSASNGEAMLNSLKEAINRKDVVAVAPIEVPIVMVKGLGEMTDDEIEAEMLKRKSLKDAAKLADSKESIAAASEQKDNSKKSEAAKTPSR